MVDVGADPLDIGGQDDGVLVRRELAVAAPPGSGELEAAGRQSGLVKGNIEQQRQVGVEARPDQSLQQAASVGAHAAAGARTLERPHVQQHGWATKALPR